jgi:hypothetical protein
MRENKEAIEAFRKKHEQELAAKQQLQIDAQRKAIEARKGIGSVEKTTPKDKSSINEKNIDNEKIETKESVKRTKFNSSGSAIDAKLAESNSLDSLVNIYPEGITMEELVTGDCKINRIIYIKNNEATEYKKITYKWGVFYKKNNKDITESMFKNEVKKLNE